jgi:heptaprenylglyceryl phosphate synthase
MLAIPVEAARADKAAVMDAYERRVGEYVAAGYLVFDADAIAAGTATPIPIDMPELVALQSQAAQAQAQAQEAAADAPTAPAGISILSDQYLQDLQR